MQQHIWEKKKTKHLPIAANGNMKQINGYNKNHCNAPQQNYTNVDLIYFWGLWNDSELIKKNQSVRDRMATGKEVQKSKSF